ncbi:MAG: sulfotransferase domain-containing protein [Anaerolineales bacterium]|nr:sulfotransferase domain-containing protein [Anaerolineales bacterium]
MPLLQRIIACNAFEHHASGRQAGEEDVHHHYRKGVVGDWRNYFTPQVTAAFRARYGALLIQLGYEKDNNW